MLKIDARRARQLAWLAMAAYIVGLGISATFRNQGDFNVYYRAGHRVLQGLAIYPPTDDDRFIYAPIFAIGFAPLAAMPRHLAQFFFFVINAFALVQFVLGAGVILFGRERQLPAPLIVLPVLLAFRFVGNNFEHGQINLPTLALITWAIVYAEEDRNARAGLMLATAILIKPFAILAALHLAILRRFGAIGWSIVAGIVLLILPVVVFGPHGLIDQTSAYLTAVASMTGRYRTMITNQSAVSAAARMMSRAGSIDAEASPLPMMAGMGFELIMVIAVLIWDWRSQRRGGSRLALCGMFCVMPSLAPVSWKSYYAAMLLPYMALVSALWIDRDENEEMNLTASILFALSVLLNLAPGSRLNRVAMFYFAHFVSSLLALAALFTLWWSKRSAIAESGDLQASASRA
ncbi:MAG: glycosyltransferase family 87 protein [Candidatus Binatus sp.]|uniref:glycosyltransferase family 87 protein n=1 Tax=Candidatus Binatus sp. TaxID=2811406 RepID=UPI002720B7F3|nr:glycosyltransferase family 87 protein [Candidatus Binatus sp.]MDO8432000.1 glycosyltransferase family 87 protein [Candidatus Binatus sp.]